MRFQPSERERQSKGVLKRWPPVAGETDPSLEEALFSRGFEFEFFQAVRLLTRRFSERKPVGGTARPSGRGGAVQRLSLAFRRRCRQYRASFGFRPAARMTVTCFLIDRNARDLPLHYTDDYSPTEDGPG